MSASSSMHGGVRRWAGAVAGRVPIVVDAYRFVRRPSWAIAVAADLRETRRTSAFLREGPRPAPDAPAVLCALYRDDVYDVKSGLVLCAALATRGTRTVVLTPSSRDHRIRRFAAAYGVTDVRSRDAVALPADERARIDRAAARLLAGPRDLASIRGWRHDDYAAGFHILSTLIRRTFDGSPDLRIEGVRGLLEAITHEVLTAYAVAARVLDDVAPRCVLVEEANYAVNGPLVDVAVARGIDVIDTKATWRDDAWISKRLRAANRRVDARSVAAETLDRLEAAGGFPPDDTLDAELEADFTRRYDGTWSLSAQNQPGTRAFDVDEITARVGLDPGKPTAIVFAHVLWDASLFYGVDLFENYTDWLRNVVRAAADNPACNWIVKTHPSNVFRLAHGDMTADASSEAEIVRTTLPELPPHVFVLAPDTPISTRSLFAAADFGLTVRGTPGLELACSGTPVLTAGTGSYSGLGFTVDSADREEYLGRLARLPDLDPSAPVSARKARRYAHTLFLRRPLVLESVQLGFAYRDSGWHPLDRNVTWAIDSFDALAASPDLGRWATWVLDEDTVDFLA